MTVFIRDDMEEVATVRLGSGRAAVLSRRSPNKSTPNEDAAIVLPYENGSAVLAVADGLGGAQAGETAAAIAVQTLKEVVLRDHNERYPLRAAIMDGIEAANRRILDLGIGAATTLAVLEIQDDTVRTYHVGDSMILMVGSQGKVKWQTVSHSPVGFAVEAGMLDEQEAMHHAQRHIVSNVVGDNEMRIEIGPTIQLAPRDRVILGSDGLFDNLHIEEITERLRKGPLARCVGDLAAEARRRMLEPRDGLPCKPDDMTMVAFALKRRRKAATEPQIPTAPPPTLA